jgi:hypothetical protein
MSNQFVPSAVGEMITLSAARSLEADCGLASPASHLAKQVPANATAASGLLEKRNWLAAVHAAISEPVGAAARLFAG